jgi:hypothetical protein
MNNPMFRTETRKLIRKILSTAIIPYPFNFPLKLVFYFSFIDFKIWNTSSFDFNK